MLGILGGLGPMSSAYFYELVTERTFAVRDQDHIDIVLSSRASTPDRTAFITGKSNLDPLSYMAADARRLVAFGAEIIAIPCNTAHYFYDSLADVAGVPLLHIVRETAAHCAALGAKKIGILATEGTISTHTYQKAADDVGIECAVPDARGQAAVNAVIYDCVKRGIRLGDESSQAVEFNHAINRLLDKGCDRLILGCTELSVFAREVKLDAPVTDSLEVLAYASIVACGAEPCGFPDDFSKKASVSKYSKVTT